MTSKGSLTIRDEYGKTLLEIGEREEIFVLDADLSSSTKSVLFSKKYKERFFNAGISEANMVSIAAGLALSGKKVFASSFASFLMCKAYDQIRVTISALKLPVVLVGSHGGISVGEDGYSQMAIEDFALALSLPNFYVLHPIDFNSTRDFVLQLLKINSPAYMRILRPTSPEFYINGRKAVIGKPEVLREGKDITIIASGLLVKEAMEASIELSKDKIEAEVIDFHTLRPFEEEILYNSLRKTNSALTCEDHLIEGGLATVISLWCSKNYPIKIDFIGINDYASSGSPKDLYKNYGLSSKDIYLKAKKLHKKN